LKNKDKYISEKKFCIFKIKKKKSMERCTLNSYGLISLAFQFQHRSPFEQLKTIKLPLSYGDHCTKVAFIYNQGNSTEILIAVMVRGNDWLAGSYSSCS
jgi:hypothetical protein